MTILKSLTTFARHTAILAYAHSLRLAVPEALVKAVAGAAQ